MEKLVALKCDGGFYISHVEKFHSGWKKLYYDGKKLQETFNKDWMKFEGCTLPTNVQKELPQKKINHRYELKDPTMENEKIPLILDYETVTYYDDDECDRCWKIEYAHLASLYVLRYDYTDAGFEDVEFEIDLKEEIELQGGFSFKAIINRSKQDVTERDCLYGIIDKCEIFEPLLFSKPCRLSSEKSFQIIRAYVKENIDSQYAVVTSDYDFCLTVKKKIAMTEIEEFMYDANIFSKKRKKMVKGYKKDYTVTIFECAPNREREGVYRDYPECVSFEGKNWDDLKTNIRKYLKNLMKVINAPIKECPHCKGAGVVLEKI